MRAIDELLAQQPVPSQARCRERPRRPPEPAAGDRDVHGLAPGRVRGARAARRRGAHPAQRRRRDHRRRDPLARRLPAAAGHARGDADPPHRLRHVEAHRRRLPRRAAGGDAASRRHSRSSRSRDLDADVRQSILRVRRSPFLPHRDVVRGFVYDVDYAPPARGRGRGRRAGEAALGTTVVRVARERCSPTPEHRGLRRRRTSRASSTRSTRAGLIEQKPELPSRRPSCRSVRARR